MAKKDYYETLGVSRGADREEIKKAYKRLAKKYHPDVNADAGSTEKFKEVSEAAAVLGDEKKREQYDRFGTATEGMGGQGFNPNDYSDFMSGFDTHEFNFDDLFEGLFGRGRFAQEQRRTQRPRRGSDLAVGVEITLEEACAGATKAINVPRSEMCEECNGTGAKSASDVSRCPDCEGTGHIQTTRRMPFGIFQTTQVCGRCRGQGKIITKPCRVCNGRGRVKQTRKIEVKIPAGIEDDMRLRLSGEGEAGQHAGEKGDLYVIVRVKQHEFFEREGNDLYCEVPVSFVQAALGAEIRVPTIDGHAKLKIPQGTQTNTIFRMNGKGMPGMNDYGEGDQLVRVVVQTPKHLSKRERELLEEYAAEGDDEPQKGFFKKLFK